VDVWYFAYGANTSTAVLTGRRGITPLSSEAATLAGWRLAFAMPGVPYFEPAFATVLEAPGATTEGVLHHFHDADMERLDGFESRGYLRRALPVVGRKSGEVEAQVYVSKRPREGSPPSRRYVELLLAGAREHQLSPEHVAWLEAHPAVESQFARFVMKHFVGTVRALLGGS
jgi:gliotoxin/aspirochlorine biosynthesis gamma-glutamylcyclotransferase